MTSGLKDCVNLIHPRRRHEAEIPSYIKSALKVLLSAEGESFINKVACCIMAIQV